jgi:ATP-binding cassette, subfamily C, type I secretion system permease/ATPase
MEDSTRLTALNHVLRVTRGGLAMVGGLSLFLNLLLLVSPLYMQQVYDRVLTSGHVETLVALTLIAGLALLVLGLLEVVRSWTLRCIGTWLDRTLSGPVLAASLGDALVGQAIGAQALRDLAQLRGFVGSQAVGPILDAPWTPLFIVIIFLLHPWLGTLAFLSVTVLFVLALCNELVTRAPLKEANEIGLAAQRQIETAMRNAEVVHAMGMLPALLQRWHSANDYVLGRQARASDRSGVILGTSKFLRQFMQIAILGLGSYLVLKGKLTSGGMIAGSILLSRALAPVEQAIGTWRGFIAARASYGRLQDLLRRYPVQPRAIRLPVPEGQVSVDELVFEAPNSNRPILRGITFELAAGEALAVVGPSASGKSTLCRLIAGVWLPTSGHVRLDGAEVHSWERGDFGRYVGYLPQDIELFAGTIRDNIARMADGTDEMVIRAAQRAGVHEMILRLPNGYATEIGAQGAVLSGGQRQRIGLARAMFGSPRLVVLDEPNASLDADGATALVDAIGRLKVHGTTIVLVAHRPSLLAHVDKLLVLRDGTAVLYGPRDEILPRITASRSAHPSGQAAASSPFAPFGTRLKAAKAL